MTSRQPGVDVPEQARVRRMRAQLVTVVSCVAGMAASYFVACAIIW